MTQFTNTSTPGSLSIDTVTDLLADHRRRRAVAVLADRGSAMALLSLARAVAAHWPDAEEAPPTDALAASLHHVHLPKLAAADAVAYDHESQVVVPEDIDALADCLDATRDERSQQSEAVSAN